GHVWVTLAVLARHADWGTLALPVQGQLYIRKDDLSAWPPERRRPCRTKLQMAAAQLGWVQVWIGRRFAEHWAFVDGAYAKRPFLRPARQHNFTVVSRLRKAAALCSVPKPVPPGQRRRGRPRLYGARRLSLAKRAGQRGGWQEVECLQYGVMVTKTI